jgi:transcriptional regulator with XRE-family HTH domain
MVQYMKTDSLATDTPMHPALGDTSGANRRFSKKDLVRLGRFMAAQRQNAEMTLRSLSERSGVSIGAIRALEAGQSNPSLVTVIAIVDALGVSLDRMMAALRPDRSDVAVVTRAGSGETELSRGLSGAVLSARYVDLPENNAGPVLAGNSRHPAFGMVLNGSVTSRLGDGRTLRLDRGDAWHARPGQVVAWVASGRGAARLLHVTDTRDEDSNETR